MKEYQKEEINYPYKANVVIAAIIFIAVGLLILGRNLDIIPPQLYRILVSWQTLLVVIGVWSMFRRHFINGVVLVGVGGFFLIPRITAAGEGWVSTYWPLIFVLLGIILLFVLVRKPKKARREYTFSDETISDTEDGFVESYNTFGSVRQIVLDPVFKGARIKVTFAGTVLDLRRTALEATETYIDVEASFGGLEIYIPDHWVVIDKITPVLAGVEDKRFRSVTEVDTAHKLILRGNINFSGIEIKG